MGMFSKMSISQTYALLARKRELRRKGGLNPANVVVFQAPSEPVAKIFPVRRELKEFSK